MKQALAGSALTLFLLAGTAVTKSNDWSHGVRTIFVFCAVHPSWAALPVPPPDWRNRSRG